MRRATPSIVPRFYLTRRQPWHASSASRTCCCATFHTRPSSARAALADPSRTASARELATDSRTALANHVAIPVLLTQPHIEAGQSQVDGVEAVSKDPGPSPCSPRRRRWLAPPRHFPLILLPNHSVLVPLHGDLNVSFIVPRLEDGSALLASRRCFSPDFHPFFNFLILAMAKRPRIYQGAQGCGRRGQADKYEILFSMLHPPDPLFTSRAIHRHIIHGV